MEICIRNLPPNIGNIDLKSLFLPFGNILYIDIKTRSGPPFAFIQYDDPRSARKASAFPITTQGYTLEVKILNPDNSTNSLDIPAERPRLSKAQRRKIAKERVKEADARRQVYTSTTTAERHCRSSNTEYQGNRNQHVGTERASGRNKDSSRETSERRRRNDGSPSASTAERKINAADSRYRGSTKDNSMHERRYVSGDKSSSLSRDSSTNDRHTMKRKSETVPSSSYGKAAKTSDVENLCYAIIDSKSSTGKIPSDQSIKVEEVVNEWVMKYILKAENDAPIIQIDSLKFTNGVLMLELATANCVDALKKLVDKIPAPWPGGKLAFVSKDKIVNFTRASFIINGWGIKLQTEEILKILDKQNSDLFVEKWQVLQREDNDKSCYIAVGIDQDSMISLTKTQGKASFMTSAIYFKVKGLNIGMDKVGDISSHAKIKSFKNSPASNSTKSGSETKTIQTKDISKETKILDNKEMVSENTKEVRSDSNTKEVSPNTKTIRKRRSGAQRRKLAKERLKLVEESIKSKQEAIECSNQSENKNVEIVATMEVKTDIMDKKAEEIEATTIEKKAGENEIKNIKDNNGTVPTETAFEGSFIDPENTTTKSDETENIFKNVEESPNQHDGVHLIQAAVEGSSTEPEITTKNEETKTSATVERNGNDICSEGSAENTVRDYDEKDFTIPAAVIENDIARGDKNTRGDNGDNSLEKSSKQEETKATNTQVERDENGISPETSVQVNIKETIFKNVEETPEHDGVDLIQAAVQGSSKEPEITRKTEETKFTQKATVERYENDVCPEGSVRDYVEEDFTIPAAVLKNENGTENKNPQGDHGDNSAETSSKEEETKATNTPVERDENGVCPETIVEVNIKKASSDSLSMIKNENGRGNKNPEEDHIENRVNVIEAKMKMDPNGIEECSTKAENQSTKVEEIETTITREEKDKNSVEDTARGVIEDAI